MQGLLEALDKFMERARKANKERALAPIRKDMERAIQRVFRLQAKAFLKGLAKQKDKFPEPEIEESGADDEWWEGLFEDSEDEVFDLFIKALKLAIVAALLMGANDMIENIGLEGSFDLENPRAVAYLEEHGAALVTKINETTREYIKSVIVEGTEQGWSYDEMAKRISERYEEFAVGKPQEHIDSRAHLVAITEVGNAYQAGNYTVIQDLIDKGLRAEKQWSTMGDDRVSDGCAENEAEGWIPAEQLHKSGDMHPLRFPGCRCDELYRVVREEE